MTDDNRCAADVLAELTGRDREEFEPDEEIGMPRFVDQEVETTDPIGEWVTIDGFDRLWRVCELDVSEERMDEVVDSGGLVGMSMPISNDEPYDLLQSTKGYALVTRDEWSR